VNDELLDFESGDEETNDQAKPLLGLVWLYLTSPYHNATVRVSQFNLHI